MLLGQHATLAQSVERLTRNEQVDSSILSSGSGTARRWACRFCFTLFRMQWHPSSRGKWVASQNVCLARRLGNECADHCFFTN